MARSMGVSLFLALNLLAGGAFALSYQCTFQPTDGFDRAAHGEKLILAIDGDNLTVTSEETHGGEPYLAERDHDYKPRTHLNYVRYFGSFGGDHASGGYNTTALFEEKLLTGADSGKFIYRARGEGYFEYHYQCQKIAE